MGETRDDFRTNLRAGVKAIWNRHALPYRSMLWVLSILGLISAAANGAVPYITGHFFDALIHLSQHDVQMSESGIPLWGTLLGGWVLVQLVANNFDWFIDRIERKLQSKLHLGIQAGGFIHLLYVPVAYHKSSHIQGDYNTFSMAAWRVSSIAGHVTRMVPQFMSVLIGLALAMSISIPLASVMVAGVVLYVILLLAILPSAARNDAETHRIWNTHWERAASHVQQIENIKQTTSEAREEALITEGLSGKTAESFYHDQLTWSNVNFFQRTIVFFVQAIVLALSVRYVADGTLTVGNLVALNAYAAMFFGPFVTFGYAWQTIQNGIVSAAQAEKVLTAQHEMYHPADAVLLGQDAGAVSFDHVSFRYESGHGLILDDASFDIKPGMSVALVGESGGGKSTAVSFISGYYFPTEGSVRIGGIDTRKLDLHDLRSRIAVVPQEAALFHDTIKNNIRYGSFDASDEAVERAAHAVHLHEFIKSQPLKYETLVGERGIKLSVGQKQRVVIARAMLRNPDILILDEPTSALDAATERVVTEALEELMKGRTTVIIAHRLSTVRKADMILVFDKGRIIEQGTHIELMKNPDGAYRRLHDYQVGFH